MGISDGPGMTAPNQQPQPVNVAVVGTGFGRLTHVPGFRACEGVNVVALVGRTLDRTRAAADELGIPLATTSLEEALALPDLHLVSIASPVQDHFPQAMAALERQKHVLVEKPLALDSRQARIMVEAAGQRGVLNAVNTQLRFNPTRQRFKSLVESGYLGRLYHISVHSYHDYRARPWSWKDTRHNGVLRAHASHMVDLVQWLFGPVAQVLCGVLETMIPQKPDAEGNWHPVECEDFASFVARLGNGAIVTFLFSSMAVRPPLRADFEPATMRIEAFGERGSLVLDLDDRLYGNQSGQAQWDEFTEPEPLLALEGVRRRVWDLSFVRLARALTGAVRGQDNLPPVPTFAQGLSVVEVLDAVFELGQRSR